MGSREQSANLKSGFSVFEIIGVMAVITIIMTMLVMSLGGVRSNFSTDMSPQQRFQLIIALESVF